MLIRPIGSGPNFTPEAESFFVTAAGFPSTLSQIWSGAPTASAITVMGDLTRPSPSVQLVVATAPSDAAIISTSTAAATTEYSNGLGGFYSAFGFTASGLNPGTRYYYKTKVEGVLDPLKWRSFKTRPTDGVATAFSFVTLSCSRINAQTAANTFAKVAELLPDFVMHLGDLIYSDIMVNDITLQRRSNQRIYRANSYVQQMLDVCPQIYVFDDHDAAGNDWDCQSGGGLGATIFANSRQVYGETTPHYTLDVAGCLAQSWRYGKTRFVMIDMRSFRTMVGGATVLGSAQKQWLKDMIDLGVVEGSNRIFICCPSGVPAPAYDGWAEYAPAEFTEIKAYANANAPGLCDFVTGDIHASGIDDGTNIGAGFRLICSSPSFNNSDLLLGGPFSWNGADSGYFTNHRMFTHTTVLEDGNWITDVYGRRNLSGTAPDDIEIVLKGRYDTRDLAP